MITNRRGLILWIDNRAAGRFRDIPDSPKLWDCLFGDRGRLVHGFLDIEIRLVASASQVKEELPQLAALRATGTDVFCVLDLKLPYQDGEEEGAIEYGLEVARLLRDARLPIVLLTANHQAGQLLSGRGLDGVSFYLKPGGSRWPATLANHVLGRFVSHLHWLNLQAVEHLVEIKGVDLDLSNAIHALYPFFGPFREFAQRWLDREHLELPLVIAFRSPASHSAIFESQSLLLVLATQFSRLAPDERLTMQYRQLAEEPAETRELLIKDRRATFILRSPLAPDIDAMETMLDAAFTRHARTIVLIPSEGPNEPVLELFQRLGVPLLDELPNAPWDDQVERLELVRRSAAVALQRSIGSENVPEGAAEYPIDLWFRHPELLIHPLDWAILLTAADIGDSISDPPELLQAFQLCLEDSDRRALLRRTIRADHPPAIEALLPVCRALPKLRVSTENDWRITGRAFEGWLRTSRSTPFGIELTDGKPHQGQEAFETHNAASWESYCLLIARQLNDTLRYQVREGGPDLLKTPLWRASSFLSRTVGLGAGKLEVDWDAVEGLRWPHDVYPMPAAVNRLLQQSGRSWWIQPEGHDLAAWMPGVKSLYKGVVTITGEYVATLRWLDGIMDALPQGWKETLGYLREVVERQDISRDWGASARSPERQQTWFALIALLRNALPVSRIASRVLAGESLGGKEDLRSKLVAAKKYGDLLGGIRKHRPIYLHNSLRRVASNGPGGPGAAELAALARLLTAADPKNKDADRGAYVTGRLLQTLRGIARTENGEGDSIAERRCTTAFSADFVQILMEEDKEDWMRKDLASLCEGSLLAWLPSLAATPADYTGLMGDAVLHLAQGTQSARYFDGYHLLSVINDLRIENKDTPPSAPTHVISRVMELFLLGVESLVAQLALVLRLSGDIRRAEQLEHPGILVEPGNAVPLPTPEEMHDLILVRDRGDDWAVGVLGIPGSGTVARFCFARPDGEVVALDRD